MKVVVVGGTGLIGSKLVKAFQRSGEAVVAASPSNGINAFTGERIAEAFVGADVVIDASNSPHLEGEAALAFFHQSTLNVVAASAEAGVRHLLTLSLVGADRSISDGYFRAKQEQEQLVLSSDLPHTILRATQFFEFAEQIADWNTAEDTIRLPSTTTRPVASDDVAAELVRLASTTPTNAVIEIGGPEEIPLDEFVRRVLLQHHDQRYIFTDPASEPRGFNVRSNALLPTPGFTPAATTLQHWIEQRRIQKRA